MTFWYIISPSAWIQVIVSLSLLLIGPLCLPPPLSALSPTTHSLWLCLQNSIGGERCRCVTQKNGGKEMRHLRRTMDINSQWSVNRGANMVWVSIHVHASRCVRADYDTRTLAFAACLRNGEEMRYGSGCSQWSMSPWLVSGHSSKSNAGVCQNCCGLDQLIV